MTVADHNDFILSLGNAHSRGQPASLLSTVEKLEQATLSAESPEDRNCYAIATILCAHSACEVLLTDWARSNAPDVFDVIAERHTSLLRAAEELLPRIGAGLPEDLIELVNVKNMLCTSLPATAPEGGIHTSLYPSAQRAAAVAREISSQCFPKNSAPQVGKEATA
jgi:hypothetical protein